MPARGMRGITRGNQAGVVNFARGQASGGNVPLAIDLNVNRPYAGATVSIEPSLWIDPEGQVRKTQQLVLSARTEKAAASIGWSFKRAGK